MHNTSPSGPGVLDVDALLAFHRATFGGARMEGEGAGAGAGAAGAGGDGGQGAGGTGTKTYDEAHVQRVAAQQKAEGERAALAKIAETLGMTPEEAATKLKAAQDAERAAMDEATRKSAEAADTKAAAEQATAAAAQETLTAKVTQALLVSGLDLGGKDAKDDERAERLSMAARLVNVAPGADDAAIKAAIDRVKTTVPQLFDEPQGNGGGGQGDPGRGPNGRQQQPGAFGKDGDTEYAKRFPSKVAQPA